MRNHCKVAQRQISVRIWVQDGGGGGGTENLEKLSHTLIHGGGGNSKAYRGGGQKVVNLGVILSGWSPVEIIMQLQNATK